MRQVARSDTIRGDVRAGTFSDRFLTNDEIEAIDAKLPDYEISAEVWHRSIQLADRARAAGVIVPLADLLIFACAKIHGLEVAHDDAPFDELTKLES